ncbi:MAG: error-prone DNA polymerase [Bauldia sp.]
MSSAFHELAVATNFSFLRGASSPEELVKQAEAIGLSGIAVCDRNSFAGVVRGHAMAKESGFPYRIGTRLILNDGSPDILAWPTDRSAYGRLCRLLSRGKLRAEKGDCAIGLPDLIEFGAGQILGVVPPSRIDAAFGRALATLKDACPQSVRLMVAMTYGAGDRRRVAKLRALAVRYGLRLLATNDVLYHHFERRQLADVVTAIREHVTVAAAGRLLDINAERYLKPPEEMARLFRELPEAVAETGRVFEQLRFSLDELAHLYPDEPALPGETPQMALERLTAEGASRRYPGGVPEKVQQQLRHELALIGRMNYPLYFLTVHDIVRFAREKGILCQGRGSAANSSVCFCLGITEVDPNRANLLFERFLSEDRNEPPDIDVDFEHERREEVIQYIYDKYGREHAGLAATVISYRSRSSIREVGKAFGLSDDAISALSGSIWGWSEEGVKPEEAKRIGLDPAARNVKQCLEQARELMGAPRHLSQHVGGFVITRDRLDEVTPVANAAMEDRTTVEWDKDDLDQVKLLKVDVLGLGMLSCIRRAFDFLAGAYGRPLTLATIPAEEEAVYRMFCRADTIGVFQIESRAQMTMLPRLRPKEFYDLVIEVAIVRPGPIQGGMVHPYLKRRQGIEKDDYPSPAPPHDKDELKKVLGRTLGVPLFQEQAMQIAIVAAGFTPGEADQLRRAMATFRRVGTIQTFRDKMVGGMTARGYTRDFAERCFKQIEGFGEYGFPESHAASFALLVYASGWIKCHYPDVFCAALLNSQPMGFYAPSQIVRDAREHGVEVRAVDVNFSDWDCTLEPEEVEEDEGGAARNPTLTPISSPGLTRGLLAEPQARSPSSSPSLQVSRRHTSPGRARGGALGEVSAHPQEPVRRTYVHARDRLHPNHAEMRDDILAAHAVRLGFRQIKGFSEADALRIMEMRGAGYDSVRDVWLRTGLTRGAIERLADADAFRSLGLDRRDALWAARALDAGSAKERLPLFDRPELHDLSREPDFALPPMRLGEHVVNDYRFLSLSLKAHPVSFLRRQITAMGVIENQALRTTRNGRRVTVSGLVLVRQRPGTASGVIFETIEDETGVANIVVWPKVLEKYRPIVLGARFVFITGKIQSESGVIHVIADHMEDHTAMLASLTAERVDLEALSRADEVRKPGHDVRGERRSKGPPFRHPRHEPIPADMKAIIEETRSVLPKGRNFH